MGSFFFKPIDDETHRLLDLDISANFMVKAHIQKFWDRNSPKLVKVSDF